MRRKKSSTTPKKRTKGKQKTFLSLLVVGIMAVAIGIPATLGLYEKNAPQGEVAAAASTAGGITTLTVTQNVNTSNGPVICEGSNFLSTYQVECWAKPSVTKSVSSDVLNNSCTPITSIIQHAEAYCRTQAPPTTNAKIKPPVPCKINGAGDVNLDGYVTDADVTLSQDFTLGKKALSAVQKLRMDVTGDGKMTIADANTISRYVNKNITTFPACAFPTPTQSPVVKLKPPVPCKVNGAGDVDLDGYITNADVVLSLDFWNTKETLSTVQKLRADVTGNGEITAADANMINAYIIKAVKTFPICASAPTPAKR